MEAAARQSLARFVAERLADLTRLLLEECEAAGEPLSEEQRRILVEVGIRLLREI